MADSCESYQPSGGSRWVVNLREGPRRSSVYWFRLSLPRLPKALPSPSQSWDLLSRVAIIGAVETTIRLRIVFLRLFHRAEAVKKVTQEKAIFFLGRPCCTARGNGHIPRVGSENPIGQHIGPSMPGGTRRWLGWVGPKVGRGRSKTAGAVNSGGMDRKSGSSRRVDGTVTTLSDLRS